MGRRVVISSPDDVLAGRLHATLRSAGLDTTTLAEDPGASMGLALLHRSGAAADAVTVAHEVEELRAPTIVLADGATLAYGVELLSACDRVIGVLDSATFDERELVLFVQRALGNARFGLAPALGPGMTVQTAVVRDHDDKRACLSALTASAVEARLPSTLIDAIEQCVDEMLMNALYDAAHDSRGRPLFEGMSSRRRIARRTDRSVDVEYAVGNGRLTVAVRDTFGSLERSVVVRHLHKGLHSEHKVDRKAGGAGLGLFLMASAATTLSFTIAPHTGTEVRCTFRGDAAPKGQLELVELAADPSVTAAARGAHVRRTPAARRQLAERLLVVASAILLPLAFLIPTTPPATRLDIVTQPQDAIVEVDGRVLAPGQRTVSVPLNGQVRIRATRDGYETKSVTARGAAAPSTLALTLEPVATLELATAPPDAAVEISGEQMGFTPLTVTTLKPEAKVTIAFDKTGYQRTTIDVTVPARGARAHHEQPLVRDPQLVLVRLTSVPPGARVLRQGAPPTLDRTYTPADVYVPRALATQFRVEMPGRAPAVVEVSPTAGDSDLTRHVELAVAP